MTEKIGKILLIVATILIPVFFLPFTPNVLDFQKQTIFLLLVSIALFSFVVKILLEGKARLNSHFFNFFVLLFVLIFGFSTLFSISKRESFFGPPLPVSESFLTVLLLAIFFWLTINFFEKKEIFYLLFFFSISVFLAEIFAIFQIFQKFIFPFDFAKSSSFNTLGTPVSFAVFLSSLFPLILILFSISKKFFKFFFLIQILLSLFLIILVNSKIAWILLLLGSVLILTFWTTRREIFGKEILIFNLFILGISLVFLIFNFTFPLNIPWEVSLSQGLSFKIALKSLKENPILGTGPGTFIYNFSKHIGKDLNDTIFWNIRFSNSASKFLDTLATTGILGTISFLLLIFLPIFFGFLQFFKPTLEKLDSILLFAIFFSLFSFSLSFFLYFPNFTFSFTYFLLLACLFILLAEKKEISFENKKLLNLIFTLLFLLILISDLAILIFVGQSYAAEIFYLKGIKEWQRGNIDGTILNLEKAIRIYPKRDIYFRDLSQVYLARTREKINRQDLDIRREVENSVYFANQATNLNPKNISNWVVRAFTFTSLVGSVSGAEDWAIKCWEEATKLEGGNPYYFTQKGIVLFQKAATVENEEERKNLISQAQENFEKAIELKPDYASAHFQLAVLWQSQGKIKEAISKLEETKVLAPFDVGLAFQLGLAYYQDNNYQKAKEELERAVIMEPNYANALYFLGLTYYQLGEKEKAIEKFKKVAEMNPEIEEIKKIISNLEEGKSPLEGITQPKPPQVPIEERPPEIKK